MKYRHVFWAILLIAIGVLFILNNFGVFDFGWRALWSLWPLILILWGISILPIKDWIKITGLVLVLAFTVTFFNRLTQHSPWFVFHNHGGDSWDWNWEEEDSDTITHNYRDQNLTVPFDSLSRKGVLRLIAAAGNFNLNGVTSDFLDFKKKGDIGNYSLTTADNNGVKTIDLTMEKNRIRHSVKENTVDIKLTDKLPWDLDFDIGAAEITLDLRDYRIDTVNVDAGASSINFKIGEKNPATHMSFNAGAASITVEIPKTSGCQVVSESFMVSKNFEGLDKKSDGHYETPDFAVSKNKIYITVKTALSKISISRY
jgi:hypothetical protein